MRLARSLYDGRVSAINFHTKEISVKLVYYGPGLCGKTTSLQAIYKTLPDERKNQFVSLATEVDRTIFFDFLPVTAYRIRDFAVRLQLYTVPGQVFYNATRKLVLNGVDGLIFVADSQKAMLDSNLESLRNLEENLADLGMELDKIPFVIQANKRDLDNIHSLEEMDRLYNTLHVPFFATIATSGEGVMEALRACSQLVVNNLVRKGLGRTLKGGNDPALGTAGDSADLSATVAAAAEAATGANVAIAATTATAPPITVPPMRSDPTAAAPAGAGYLWPEGCRGLGLQLEAALAEQRWTDAVLSSQQLIEAQSRHWARSSHYEGGDPVPAFLLLRGVTSHRYRTLTQAAMVARQGKTVVQSDAMAALIIALQAVW